jgi:hypothetical protein
MAKEERVRSNSTKQGKTSCNKECSTPPFLINAKTDRNYEQDKGCVQWRTYDKDNRRVLLEGVVEVTKEYYSHRNKKYA